jgi:predicted metal-dependent phosphoesterase TrpH
MSLGLRGPALRQELSSAKAAGVAGIEAWHPNHSVKDCRMLARLARSLGMVVTGGSDFHGANVPQRRLGRTAGGREVPDELLETLALHPAAR